MLASSWKSKGKIKPVWHAMPVPTGKREELARRTGIRPNDLSAMNQGHRVITLESATRIIDAARPELPGLTLLDLGAPEAAAPAEAASIHERLAELEDALNALARERREDLVSLAERVVALERRLQPRTARGES